jgi:Zn-dependent protease
MSYRPTGSSSPQGGLTAYLARLRRDPQALIAVGLILVALYAVRHSISTVTWLEIVVIIPSIMLHEVAHGVVALACGDDTAKRAGRLTLNPIKHVDPIGTLVLPVVLALAGLGTFGYAKPVPVNPQRMRHPRNDHVLVSLAGPATNLALAGLSVFLLRDVWPDATGDWFILLYLLGFLNVILAIFNAIPIPPLDGSVLVERFLPTSALPAWWAFRRYAMIGLVILVLLDPGHVFTHIFNAASREWDRVAFG